MADARQRADWERTGLLASFLYNANRDPKRSRAMGPDDFNPYTRKGVAKAGGHGGGDGIEVPFDVLKVFVPAARDKA